MDRKSVTAATEARDPAAGNAGKQRPAATAGRAVRPDAVRPDAVRPDAVRAGAGDASRRGSRPYEPSRDDDSGDDDSRAGPFTGDASRRGSPPSERSRGASRDDDSRDDDSRDDDSRDEDSGDDDSRSDPSHPGLPPQRGSREDPSRDDPSRDAPFPAAPSPSEASSGALPRHAFSPAEGSDEGTELVRVTEPGHPRHAYPRYAHHGHARDEAEGQGPGRDGPLLRGPARHVDPRQLEAALLNMRERIRAAFLVLGAPGVAQAEAVRKELLSQIDDYLLPRLHRPAAPILVAVVGSTGAGKSTLVNSVVGERVSATGIRRPTTNSPVLACHPDDADWFAENRFLPTLPRVRQEGLARPGRDGLLVIAASARMPRGLALLDTPDIDSVVRAHYDFAHQFLDASDLWLFVTTAARYADAPVWELLQHARERGASLGIVLSRVPESGHSELVSHFCAMLEANGIDEADRFVIPETVVADGTLPAEVFAPVRSWLEEAAVNEDRRVAVLTQTMSGVLDTFRIRVPELAAQVEAQVGLRVELQGLVERAYDKALADLDELTMNGSLFQGGVLARWQDFAGTGELLRTLQVRNSRGTGQPRRRRNSVRLRALETALRSGLESLIVSVGDRAAEEAVTRWRAHPAGTSLLESAGGATGGSADGGGHDGERDRAPALAASSPSLARRAAMAVSGWQDHVRHLVRAEGVTKRSVARVVSFDDESLAVVFMIDVLGYGAGAAGISSAGSMGVGGGSAGGGSSDTGSAGTGSSGTASSGTAFSGTASSGIAFSGTASSGSASSGAASVGGGSARTGFADTGFAGASSVGTASAGITSAGGGSARTGFADTGSAGAASAGITSAGGGSAGSGFAGTGLAGTGLASTGSADTGSIRTASAGSGSVDSASAGAASAGTAPRGRGVASTGFAGAGSASAGSAGTGPADGGSHGSAGNDSAASDSAATDSAATDSARTDLAGTVPQRLLGSLLGPGPLRAVALAARADLQSRLSLLFAEEMLRFAQLADAAGVPDEAAAVHLHQAAFALENAR
ncbi:MAG TPA: dynamin family protein [Streptosporangiaceae bacterium]|nr:dynamin family protein [Streptosporangiaceae bacterium]